ncbi:GNAT family N-acetyltransferase [Kribbella shirazensis]|uniref:Ribosomal protein S18 acetylase RimI-like enzyme n=1 Tax=Kribbella shirazensis TaxID=1105143 RepID=A0A7X6A0Y6_9ACTN|nr:ribosomal protein S18 acetylase RimI-like enzyme [Kribbella shirazensis]
MTISFRKDGGIRDRRAEDLPVCVQLLREVHQRAGYPINWPGDPVRWLTPDGALGCWVAVDKDRVVGHVALTAVDDRAEVERLFVDPEATRKGIGRRLLEHCVTTAAELGRELSLEVVDDRGSAIHLYRRAGWLETGRTPIDWGGDRASELIRFAGPKG